MAFDLFYSIIVPVLTILALLYAGINDLLYREVRRELVWLLMVIAGIILDTLYVIFADDWAEALLSILVTICFGFVVGFVLFYAGVWGGADTKAIWSLSILTPVAPFDNLVGNQMAQIPFFSLVFESSAFSLLLNSSLLAIFYPLILVVMNAIRARKYPLFAEVQGTLGEKILCFLVGYLKPVDKINEKKLHFDFFEELPDKKFRGEFEGNFDGRLDGKFIGVFEGEIDGEFQGKVAGILKRGFDGSFDALKIEDILNESDRIASFLERKRDNDHNAIEHFSVKHGSNSSVAKTPSELSVEESEVKIDGNFRGSIKGFFKGVLEGTFEGKLGGKFIGRLQGNFFGTSSKGKISGAKTNVSDDWRLKIRVGLEDEEIMDKRLLRTIQQLRAHNKKTVWITPGLPFVFLMLFGYILYLLVGNIALLVFSL